MVWFPSKVASLSPAGQAQALVTAESIVSRKAIMMICNGARVVAGSERCCGCAEVRPRSRRHWRVPCTPSRAN